MFVRNLTCAARIPALPPAFSSEYRVVPSLPLPFSHAVLGLSSALDLVSPSLVRHHVQTTTIAGFLGAALGLTALEQSQLGIAAALHDIGAISLNREVELFSDESDLTEHAEIGWLLLRSFPPFAVPAVIVRHHHTPWRAAAALWQCDSRVRLLSQIVHLADRAAVLIRPERFILAQSREIVAAIERGRGELFAPEVVDAFVREAERDVFWLEAVHAELPRLGRPADAPGWSVRLDPAPLLQLSELFRMIIDFRCQHTATHSKTVAAVGETLARKVGFSGQGCAMIHVAGNLHDLGKLAVPVAILEKPGALTPEEHAVIRCHPYHTRKILDRIGGLDEISSWASAHHEHLDGGGYPSRMTEEHLPLGARIVAIADIFSALNEDRSYRRGLQRHEVLPLMRAMAAARQIDPFIFSLIERDYDELSAVRSTAAEISTAEFNQVRGAMPR